MFYSDFDPPSRTRSVRGLLGIVAAVLLGIGVTVYGYVAEADPGQGAGIGLPRVETQARTNSGEAAGPCRVHEERVRPVQPSTAQHRTVQHVDRSRTQPAGADTRQTPAAVSQPTVESSRPLPTATSAPAPPSSIGAADRRGPASIPPADV